MSLIMKLMKIVTILFGISIFWSEKINIEYNIFTSIKFSTTSK